eukprot:2647241-Amphidinium_carterae.1
MKHPRSGNPRDLYQGIAWLEDFFNRYIVAVNVKALLEPKEVLAFVNGIVKHCYAQNMEMSMAWIEMKNKFQVTHKTFDHMKLDGLLRELVVKLRMRQSNARVDSALGIANQPTNRPGARSPEADAHEARTPPKKKPTTPPKRKLCSSYARAKGCAQGEMCPLFDKGGHPRMHNKCLPCGSEEHMAEPDEPEQEDEEGDEQEDQENDEDHEDADAEELDPENDEYDLVGP